MIGILSIILNNRISAENHTHHVPQQRRIAVTEARIFTRDTQNPPLNRPPLLQLPLPPFSKKLLKHLNNCLSNKRLISFICYQNYYWSHMIGWETRGIILLRSSPSFYFTQGGLRQMLQLPVRLIEPVVKVKPTHTTLKF